MILLPLFRFHKLRNFNQVLDNLTLPKNLQELNLGGTAFFQRSPLGLVWGEEAQ